MKTAAVFVVGLCGAQAFVAPAAGVRPSMAMSAQSTDRANFIKSAVTAAGVFAAAAAPAFAEIDNPVIPYLGGSDKVDINNANVRAYVKLPGMYPSAAGKIVSGGPYKDVADLYNIKGLTDKEKAVIKKYESKFVALEPQAMYTIDRINNGLYR